MREHLGMAFNTRSELRTFAALQAALGPLGYSISQKVRVLDVVRAAAANPMATKPVGPSVADAFLPAIREAQGPFGPRHPWLREGDWSYAYRSHFDFVVHAPLDDEHPTHPLFAVEFDGPSHRDPEAQVRDCRKNRLCHASGLPLVRIDHAFLHGRERIPLVQWLAELWAAHRVEMPRMLAERDEEVASMSQEELDAAGMWLLGEHPELDVDLCFRLSHPFPATERLAQRLADRHGFVWSLGLSPAVDHPRWTAGEWEPPIPALDDGPTERWKCRIWVRGVDGQETQLGGLAQVRRGYPLSVDEEVPDTCLSFLAGKLAYLPAGPFTSASSVMGEALCLHNALVEAEHWLRRHDRASNATS
jgi:hypothetical protein